MTPAHDPEHVFPLMKTALDDSNIGGGKPVAVLVKVTGQTLPTLVTPGVDAPHN